MGYQTRRAPTLPSMLQRHRRHIALVVPNGEHDVPLIPDPIPPLFLDIQDLYMYDRSSSGSSFQGRMHNIVGSIQSEINCLLTVQQIYISHIHQESAENWSRMSRTIGQETSFAQLEPKKKKKRTSALKWQKEQQRFQHANAATDGTEYRMQSRDNGERGEDCRCVALACKTVQLLLQQLQCEVI